MRNEHRIAENQTEFDTSEKGSTNKSWIKIIVAIIVITILTILGIWAYNKYYTPDEKAPTKRSPKKTTPKESTEAENPKIETGSVAEIFLTEKEIESIQNFLNTKMDKVGTVLKKIRAVIEIAAKGKNQYSPAFRELIEWFDTYTQGLSDKDVEFYKKLVGVTLEEILASK